LAVFAAQFAKVAPDLGYDHALQAGVFFGIYYCMTGVHAIHIIAGIGVLIWLLVRSVQQLARRSQVHRVPRRSKVMLATPSRSS
jgi:heme/copper-type cytochrome/quinol oxidase subunit 3